MLVLYMTDYNMRKYIRKTTTKTTFPFTKMKKASIVHVEGTVTCVISKKMFSKDAGEQL